MSNPTTTTTSVIDTYLAAYGETNEERRRAQIGDAFREDATLADPPFETSGHDGIGDTFAAVQSQFPGHTFRRTSSIDQHHDAARYEWELRAPDGTVAVAGTDFVRFGDDGRIASVTGFFGPVPQLG